jgi:hypothetical protein
VLIFYFILIIKTNIAYITYKIQTYFIDSGIIESVAPTQRETPDNVSAKKGHETVSNMGHFREQHYWSQKYSKNAVKNPLNAKIKTNPFKV